MIENYSELDTIAYDLYYNNQENGITTVYKRYFIKNKDIFKNYYEQAKIILRKRKLEKLNEKTKKTM
jgi:hypothetical protein